MQVISVSRPEWIHPFTGLQPTQFRRLVRLVAQRGGDTIADGRPGRQWALDLPDRVLLVAAYWRSILTMRQIGPPFGVSHSAAHRVIDTLGPLLALAPVRRRPADQIAIRASTSADDSSTPPSGSCPLTGRNLSQAALDTGSAQSRDIAQGRGRADSLMGQVCLVLLSDQRNGPRRRPHRRIDAISRARRRTGSAACRSAARRH